MEKRGFNPANKQLLESPERYKILPPYKTLKFLGLVEDDIMIDVGCGTGYFTIPAAQITGQTGKVIGLDVSEVMLDELRKKISGHPGNIELILSDHIQFPIHDSTGTFVLLSNVLHEAEDMITMLKEANRALKHGGRLAIIEWEKKEMPMGPPIEDRLHADEIFSMVSQAGFVMPKIVPTGEFHIGCTAVKK